jgi:hypothetical protein
MGLQPDLRTFRFGWLFHSDCSSLRDSGETTLESRVISISRCS